jgi:hypothetical protein
MYLVQLLLPLYDNSGRPFAPAKLNRVKTLLTRSFGGITMFRRSPAEGLSEEGSGVVRDDIVIFEVMTAQLDRQWWKNYRGRLEKQFSQDRIIVRASPIDLL